MIRMPVLLLLACLTLMPGNVSCQEILGVDAVLIPENLATEFSLLVSGQLPKPDGALTIQCEKHKYKEARQVSPADFVTRNGLHEIRIRLVAPFGGYRIDFPDAETPFFLNTERLGEKLTGSTAASAKHTPDEALRRASDKMVVSAHIPSVSGASRVLIVVFDEIGRIADQYYGEMPRHRVWKSGPLPSMQYRHRVIGIDARGNGKEIAADVFSDIVPR